MTAYSATIPSDNNSDVALRNWATVISNAFSTAWVQTADTGQINLGTATHSGATNVINGYQIWKMNDALQATAPCYVKIEYGNGGSSAWAALGITVGTGSDGTGNITGGELVTGFGNGGSTNRIIYQLWQQGSSNLGVKVSVDSNRICMYLWIGASYTSAFFAIERTHNASGADTSAGIMFFSFGCPWTIGNQNWPVNYTLSPGIATSFWRAADAQWNVVVPNWISSSAWSTDVFTYPVRTVGQGETSPSLQVSLYHNIDLTAWNLIPVTWWDNVARTSLPIGLPYSQLSWGSASAAILMRFD